MMTNLMTILERKAFISSNPRIVLSSCPPPCGHFSIQESATGGLSYKVKKETYQQDSTGVILDVSIMNGFETITRLGGYILIFSLVFTCIRHYWPFSEQTSILFTSPIELTTGLQQIAHSRYSWRFRCISSITLTAFGGLCVMFQTKSVLENRLSLFPYVTSKCLNTSLVFLFLVLSDIV